jgi:hypothetical protein
MRVVDSTNEQMLEKLRPEKQFISCWLLLVRLIVEMHPMLLRITAKSSTEFIAIADVSVKTEQLQKKLSCVCRSRLERLVSLIRSWQPHTNFCVSRDAACKGLLM